MIVMTEKGRNRIAAADSFAGCMFFALLMLVLSSCGRHNGGSGQAGNGGRAMDSTLVIAMLGDADYLNPVLGSTVTSGNIIGLIYPSLLQSEFDTATGLVNYIALEKN